MKGSMMAKYEVFEHCSAKTFADRGERQYRIIAQHKHHTIVQHIWNKHTTVNICKTIIDFLNNNRRPIDKIVEEVLYDSEYNNTFFVVNAPLSYPCAYVDKIYIPDTSGEFYPQPAIVLSKIFNKQLKLVSTSAMGVYKNLDFKHEPDLKKILLHELSHILLYAQQKEQGHHKDFWQAHIEVCNIAHKHKWVSLARSRKMTDALNVLRDKGTVFEKISIVEIHALQQYFSCS